MSVAFVTEAQIWPQMRDDPDLVMFALNWSDNPDHVCHKFHHECPTDTPHLFTQCGRFFPRRGHRAMKAVKKPIPIEVVEFQPDTRGVLPVSVMWRSNSDDTYAVFNSLHNSWIEVKPGDYLNVNDQTGRDIYPIDRETFERTYDIVID